LVCDRGLIQIAGEDVDGNWCLAGRHLHELVYWLVKWPCDVVELETSDIKPSDPKLGGDVQTFDKCLVLSYIVRDQKMNSNHIPHARVEREMKTSPTLAPLFISDPSKYII
jgi:hypothetical protein